MAVLGATASFEADNTFELDFFAAPLLADFLGEVKGFSDPVKWQGKDLHEVGFRKRNTEV